MSERRGCAALRFHRSAQRYRGTRDGQAPLRLRIGEVAPARVRYGYSHIRLLLRREGWPVNRKRVYRLYRQEGLSLRQGRSERHVIAGRRSERPLAARSNEQWSMDSVSDALLDGRRIGALTLVGNYTREALAIVVDSGIRGERVFEAVKAVASRRGAPGFIRVDNGPESASKVLDRWAYEWVVTLDFSRPSKPTDNAFVESVNGRLLDEYLDTRWALSVEDARAKI